MELRISPKHAREICNSLRGMKVKAAKSYLEDVIALKRAVLSSVMLEMWPIGTA